MWNAYTGKAALLSKEGSFAAGHIHQMPTNKKGMYAQVKRLATMPSYGNPRMINKRSPIPSIGRPIFQLTSMERFFLRNIIPAVKKAAPKNERKPS